MKGQKEMDEQKPSPLKLKICMLLPFPPYNPNDMRIAPQIGICSYLTNFGHQVTWVIWSDKSSQVQPFFFNDVHVHSAPYTRYFAGDSDLVKGLSHVPNIFKRVVFALKIFKKGKCDLLFVRESILDGLLAVYLKRGYKIPFVFELVNPLEGDWEGYKMAQKRPLILYYLIAKFSTLMKIYIMKRADLVLPTTRWFEEGLIRKGIARTKLMPYPNGVDIESFLNKNGKDIRQRYRLGNSNLIIYTGTMGKARSLSVLIEAFAKVKKGKKKVKLLMVGEGDDKENLERLADNLGIKEDIIFTGQVPQSEVPYFIAAADIGVSSVPPLPFYIVSSPIKVLECMAMAKPTVANKEIFEHKEVLEQSGGGILVPFTAEAFASAMIELLNNPEKAAGMGKSGQEWVIKNRSYEVLARRLETRCFKLFSEV